MKTTKRDDGATDEVRRLGSLSSWPAFWAELANVGDLKELSPAQITALFASYRRLGAPAARNVSSSNVREEPDSVALRSIVHLDLLQNADRPEHAYSTIRAAYDLALRIRSLLADDSPGVSIPRPAANVIFRLQHDGVLMDQGWDGPRAVPPLFALWSLLRPGKKFPIRACRKCNRIFACVGRQVFCGKACKEQARDARRKSRPSRKATQRRAAESYRERQKTRSAPQSRSPSARRR